jgi:hypothetical protein
LQLCLKEGETLETAAGQRIKLGGESVELAAGGLGGWIRHRGWRLKVPASARLAWPLFPHNPYADAPETSLQHAVGALSVPLELKARPGHYVRPGEQEILFTVVVP